MTAAKRDGRYPIPSRGGEGALGCFVPIAVVLLGIGAYFQRSPALALIALGVAMSGLLAVRLLARRGADIERMFLRDHDEELRGIVEWLSRRPQGSLHGEPFGTAWLPESGQERALRDLGARGWARVPSGVLLIFGLDEPAHGVEHYRGIVLGDHGRPLARGERVGRFGVWECRPLAGDWYRVELWSDLPPGGGGGPVSGD